MIKIQLVVIGGTVDFIPDFQKDQTFADLKELGIAPTAASALLNGDVEPSMSKREGSVYEYSTPNEGKEVIARVTVNLFSGQNSVDRAF